MIILWGWRAPPVTLDQSTPGRESKMANITHASVWFAGATHKPSIGLTIDDNLAKPYVVMDTGRGLRFNPFFLSRHKSDLAARRALCQYRRLIEYRHARRRWMKPKAAVS